ncbi:MAG: NAD-dependent epimerase/dehydratase family protein [Pseudomonadota bacterium]
MMHFERAFITGGAGFIGSRLAESLKQRGVEVTIFDSFHPQVHDANSRRAIDCLGVNVYESDVADASALKTAMSRANPDIVYHLAAETGTGQSYDEPSRYSSVNVIGTSNLIEALRQLPKHNRRVVLAGSRAVYGEGAYVNSSGNVCSTDGRAVADMNAGRFGVYDENQDELKPIATPETFAPIPASVYASTKLMQELLLQQCSVEGDYEIGLLRFQNVYGPGQSLKNPYTGVLSIFASQILQGKTLNIFEDGNILRDFVYVNDVVDSLVRCGEIDQLPTGPVNIGSGQAATILDTAKTLLRHLCGDERKYEVSGAFRPGDVRNAVANIDKAKQQLGWAPKVELEQGLSHLANWAKESLQDAF